MMSDFKNAIFIKREKIVGAIVIVITMIICFILLNIDQFLATSAAFIFCLFIIVQYKLNWIIASILVTGAIYPTGISQAFLGDSFKPFFSSLGGLSIGALLYCIWIVASAFVSLREPSTLFGLVKRNPLHLLFILYSGGSILFAPDIGEAIQAFGRLLTLYSMFLIFYSYSYSYSAGEMESKKKEIRTYYNGIALWIIITGPMLALFGLNPTVRQHPATGIQYSGIFGLKSPAYIAVCFFFVIYYLTSYIYLERKGRYLVALMFFAITGILTFSITGLVASMIGFLTWILIARVRFSVRAFSIVLILVIGVFLLLCPIGDKLVLYRNLDIQLAIRSVLRDPANYDDYIFTTGRARIWQIVWNRAFVGHEIFGSGAGASTYYAIMDTGTRAEVAHGEYIRLLSEYGVVGTALYLGAMIIWGLWSLRNAMEFEKLIIVPLLSYLLVFMAADNALDLVSQSWMYLFCTLAIALRCQELISSDLQSLG